mmetsp:Transcript_12188/g.33821  ORF Transcript_12188/g.33821 Transcript_12188/m.33821 type:complete len:87 (+) Transcript_12188:643-903(+)
MNSSLVEMQGFGGEKASSEDSDPATFEPNEDTFWKAVDRVSITVSSKRLVEDDGAEGETEDAQVCKNFLDEYVSAFLDDYCARFCS